jgi:hypothetical protein
MAKTSPAIAPENGDAGRHRMRSGGVGENVAGSTVRAVANAVLAWGTTMPRFFFHTQTTVRFTDEEGTELKGPVEARKQAKAVYGEMIRDTPDQF